MALSRRSTDIRKASERVGSDLDTVTETLFWGPLIAKAKKLHGIGEQLL